MVVRFEVDAFVPGVARELGEESAAQQASKLLESTAAATDDAALWDASASAEEELTGRMSNLWESPSDNLNKWGSSETKQDRTNTSNGTLDDSPLPPTDVKVLRAGTLVPQASILELATRSINYADRTSEGEYI